MKTDQGWILSYSGRKVFPLDPRPEDFSIAVVAHALSLKCRYNGHCEFFYSVAYHSILVSQHVEPRHALIGLLHELDEVFLPDVPRPIKPFLRGWKAIAERNMIAGCQAFGIEYPFPEQVHYVDAQMLNTEKEILMPDSEPWEGLPPKLDLTLSFLYPKEVEDAFVSRYREIVGESDNPYFQLDRIP